MKGIERFAGFFALLLLCAFFTPYVVKLTQWDIALILLGGLVLAAYDFLTSK